MERTQDKVGLCDKQCRWGLGIMVTCPHSARGWGWDGVAVWAGRTYRLHLTIVGGRREKLVTQDI